MTKKLFTTSLGAGVAALVLAVAPLAPAAAATNAWGVWTDSRVLVSSPGQPLTFTGTGMVNATWTVTGASSYSVYDTQSESEYFVADTPIGSVFGANGPSTDTNFLLVDSVNDTSTAAITTVTFDSAVPAGQLGFAVSDLDSDHVTVTATDASDAALTGAQIVGTATPVAFNFCDYASAPCSDTAVPTITTNANDVVAEGTVSNTNGSTAWFMPNVAVKSVTFTYVNDDIVNTSSSRYWFAQTVADTLPQTGMNSSLSAGVVGFGIALLTAGALLVIRRGRKA